MTGHRTRRILMGLGGQASGRLIVAIYQLAIMPVMIHVWGLDLYGEWLIVTGVATYLAVSNHGLTAASAMAVIRLASQDDHAGANAVIGTSLAIVLVVTSTITAVVAMLLAWSRLPQLLSLAQLPVLDLAAIAIACGVQVAGASARTLPIAACDAEGYYGRPQMLSSAFRLVEFGGTVALVLSGFDPVTVAWWMAAIVLADWLAQVALARRRASWAQFRLRMPRWTVVRDLVRPSAGHTVISVAVNALSVQGMRLLVSAILGPAAVGVLSIYTAVTRVTDHLAAMILPVLQLEFARMPEDSSASAGPVRMIGASQMASLLVFGVYTLVAALFGNLAFKLLSAGNVAFDLHLFLLFSLAVLAVQFGRSNLTYLMGRNLVGSVAAAMLGGWLLALAVAAITLGTLGIAGAAISLMVGEAWASLAATALVARHFRLSPARYAISLLSIRPLTALLGRRRSPSTKATAA